MLMVGVPKNEIAALDATGAHVKINSRPTVLRRRGGYLLYADGSGNELRCRILDSTVSGDHVMFFAASHGQEDEPHSIIRPKV